MEEKQRKTADEAASRARVYPSYDNSNLKNVTKNFEVNVKDKTTFFK